jgi:hypothetical protein
LHSLGAGVEILGDKKNKPHDLAVQKRQGERKNKQNQFVGLKPEYLDRLGQVLRKPVGEVVFSHLRSSLVIDENGGNSVRRFHWFRRGYTE